MLVLIVALVTASAVQGGRPGAGDDTPEGGGDALPEDSSRPVPDLDRVDSSPGPALTGEVPEDALRPVLADASDRSGVTVGELEILRAEYVDWPDGSLGCPEPGMYYTQAIEPGYWVEVRVGEVVLDYRLTVRGSFRLCESGLPGVAPGSGDSGGGTGGPPDS
jgi:hypothetical protein